MKNTDMTRGNILRELTSFTLPLIFGNVFQLTYNMVDTIVIGRFAGSDALAAVGTSDPVMSVLILGVSGVCIGASVLMSYFFGAGNEEKLKEELKTTVFMGLLSALLITVIGFASDGLILRLLSVPETVMGQAETYLRIIFLGMPFTCLYNIYAAALRSIGDSGTPLRYLIVSTVMNMGLDLLFVAAFSMGVAGAGLATVIAEAVSAILCIVHVRRKVPLLRYEYRGLLKPDRELAVKTLRYGGVTALQQCAQPIGNLLIQGTVNTLGVASIAAFSAVRKIEDIGLVPGRTIGTSMTTFTAQNRGALNGERTEKGYWIGMGMEAAVSVLVCLVILTLKRPLMLLFTEDEGIVTEGLRYYAVMAAAYWMPCTNNGRQGYLRGVGAMKSTLFGTLTQISFRVIFTVILVPRIGIAGIGYACMAGWIAQMAWQEPYRMHIRGKQ